MKVTFDLEEVEFEDIETGGSRTGYRLIQDEGSMFIFTPAAKKGECDCLSQLKKDSKGKYRVDETCIYANLDDKHVEYTLPEKKDNKEYVAFLKELIKKFEDMEKNK